MLHSLILGLQLCNKVKSLVDSFSNTTPVVVPQSMGVSKQQSILLKLQVTL